MTKSVYICGGPLVGKSTFMAELLKGTPMGPLEDIFSAPNSRGTMITLRGQRLPDGGLYLGHMREGNFPGTDALDRVSPVAGIPWLMVADLPAWIIGEGATLGTNDFLNALAGVTDMLLLHLRCSSMTKVKREKERGSQQDPNWIRSKVTQAKNTFERMDRENRCDLLDVDTDEPEYWHNALAVAAEWLEL